MKGVKYMVENEMKWKTMHFNLQNIRYETQKAVSINMPKKSRYKGFSFWIPKSFVFNGGHSYDLKISIPVNFKIKLQKFGNGKYNQFSIIDEVEISVDDLYTAVNYEN